MSEKTMALTGGVATEAGRELDALVAEKVFGATTIPDAWGSPMRPGTCWTSDPTGHYTGRAVVTGVPIPYYSTDIAAAWTVVEKMPGHFDLWQEHGGLWAARFLQGPTVIGETRRIESAPLAICLAALKVIALSAEKAPVGASPSTEGDQ